MRMQIMKQELVYPLEDTKIGEEFAVDADGNSLTRMEPLRDRNGNVRVHLITTDEGILQLKPIMQEVKIRRDIIEARPNTSRPSDGVRFRVVAWDENTETVEQGRVYEFTIGKSAFDHVAPAERIDVIRKEVEIYYFRDKPPVEQPWTEGLPSFENPELVPASPDEPLPTPPPTPEPTVVLSPEPTPTPPPPTPTPTRPR